MGSAMHGHSTSVSVGNRSLAIHESAIDSVITELSRNLGEAKRDDKPILYEMLCRDRLSKLYNKYAGSAADANAVQVPPVDATDAFSKEATSPIVTVTEAVAVEDAIREAANSLDKEEYFELSLES